MNTEAKVEGREAKVEGQQPVDGGRGVDWAAQNLTPEERYLALRERVKFPDRTHTQPSTIKPQGVKRTKPLHGSGYHTGPRKTKMGGFGSLKFGKEPS